MFVDHAGRGDRAVTDPTQPSDDLDELRADLAQFVLREAGQAVARDPALPLSAALTQAIHQEAEKAAQRHQDMLPRPEALSASVMDVLRPQLIEVVQAAAQQDAGALSRRGGRGASLSLPVVGAIAIAVALLAFAGGFGVARFLTPAPAPQPAVVEPALPPTAPAGDLIATDPATTVPTDPAATAPAGPQAPTP